MAGDNDQKINQSKDPRVNIEISKHNRHMSAGVTAYDYILGGYM